MRVSTAQFYFQNSQQLSNSQFDVNSQMEHLASGKRILSAKDDAVAYSTMAGLKGESQTIAQFQRNITQAENRNSLQDVTLGSAVDLMQNIKQLLIQANNGALSESDLSSIATEINDRKEQLLNLANSQDETGGYIFSGYQTDVKPFSLHSDDSVSYQGDNGIRQIAISKNIDVALNQSGASIFQNVANALGDFTSTYNTNSSVAINSAKVADASLYDTTSGAGTPPPFKVTFTSATDVTVTDADGDTIYSSTSYSSGDVISMANGVEIELSGQASAGDEITLTQQENISIFDTLTQAINWSNHSDSGASEDQRQIDYRDILKQFDSALNHLVNKRADAGIRLNMIEHQKNQHLDNNLTVNKNLSGLEDLDFAKAVSNFEQSKIALQAAQQSFVQIKDLNLFNFI